MGYDLAVSTPPPPALITLHADARAQGLIEAELGLSLSTHAAASAAGDLTAIPVGPTEWLLVAPPHEEEALTNRIETTAEGSHFDAVVVSDALCLIRVTGPQVHDALCQAVAVDLRTCFQEPGTTLRCGFGKTSAILHYVGSEPTFDIYVESPLSTYATKLLEVASGAE